MTTNSLFGLKLKKMGEELLSQTSRILADLGFQIDKRTIPVLIILIENGAVGVNELADHLGMTHPAIVQVVDKLNMKGFISKRNSTKDKRRTLIEITRKGRTVMRNINPILEEIQGSIDSVIKNIDGSLPYSLLTLENFIKSKVLINSVNEKLKENAMKEVEIVPYNKRYKKQFSRLNYEWLQKYFEVEEEDQRLLEYPEREIINKGGEVFFGLISGEVVGTVAVAKINKTTYELTKMAVTEKARGKKVGKKLALTTIGFAVERKAKILKLSTSYKLIAALNLYKTLGFVEIPNEYDNRYKRELIHMELDLVE
jgi:DNA-binding MarR family transcriptional regulator/predicted GNAT family N-acyltransferase